MFKKFSKTEDVASNTAIKSSHQRGIRSKLLEQMPLLAQPGGPSLSDDPEAEPLTLLDVLWPKKEAPALIKCREHISLLALHGQPLFFQHFDGPYMPTLRLLQQYPDLLPKVQIDKGGIKFILAGANVMCPGLTSKGGYLTPGLKVGQPVAIFAEGKETPCAIGIMKMTTDDIKNINKGHGIENATYLGDDLWLNAKDF